MKTAIIIGATSGIGRYLAIELSKRGYKLGLTGRRIHLLESLQNELSGPSEIMGMDITQFDKARKQLSELLKKLPETDLLVLNAGVASYKREFKWDDEKRIIETNVTGFCSLLNTGWHYFAEKGSGHIVGISSIASYVPNGGSTAYNASKAFVSNYLAGLQVKARKDNVPILITDIKPGFVATPMTEKIKNKFWESSVDKACEQIADAIEKRKPHAYVTKRWRFVGLLVSLIPNAFYRKFGR